MPINWQQFGLKKDPYDTLPLREGGDLPIEKAFIGRDAEKDFLNNIFESSERTCLALCGDVGVGKTSLANFHKFVWKYHKPKLLFSFRREIEASNDLLDKKVFLLEIMGSVLREIRLMDPGLLQNELLTKISRLIDVTQTLSISTGLSILGYGGIDFGKGKTITNPLQLSVSTLEEYFIALLHFLKQTPIANYSYSGLIVHVNNFDILLSDPELKKRVASFFNEIRDILQTPDVYFLFLGPGNFFRDCIAAYQRVKSVFVQTPLRVSPLSKKEIVLALNERLNILKSDDVKEVIKPIQDDVVFRLYDLYDGDIRSIMASIRDILDQYSDRVTQPLSTEEAMFLLGKERWSRIENVIKLTEDQKGILKYLAAAGKHISQKEVGKLFNKAQSNVSGYYFRPLKENGIIEEKEKVGKIPYYGLTQDYTPLQWLLESQTKMKKSIVEKNEQLGMF